MCPYYLDGDLAQRNLTPLAERFGHAGPGDTRYSAAAYRWRLIVASVQFSRTVERRITPAGLAPLGHAALRTYPREPADAGLSKLNSMLGSFAAACRERLSSQGARRRTAIQPGSVDMLGPIRLVIARPHTHFGHLGPGDRSSPLACAPNGVRRTLDRGTARCSLERR